MAVRKDPEKHADQVRRANAARAAAVNRLIQRYPNVFKKLYEEEAAARGVAPTGRRT